MLISILLNLCALQSSGDFRYATVSVDSADIHAFYDAKSVVVYTATKDMPLKVVADMYPWSKVQIPGGYDLWVYKSLTTLDEFTGLFHVNGSRTRSRPLPSTASNSYPLGVFPLAAELIPLVVEEEWIKVRAPESISAWVLSSAITKTDKDLSSAWSGYSAERAAVSVIEVIVEETVTETSEPQNPSGADSELTSVFAVAETAPPLISDFDEAAIAVTPQDFFKVAMPALEQLADAVAKDYQAYDFEFVSLIETQLGYVLWHTSDVEHIASSRAALAKLDGMRSYYISRIASQLIDTPLAQQGKLNPKLRALRDRAMFSRDTSIDSTGIIVGWIEFKPRAQATYPFEIVRGKSNYLVQSFDSHYKLRDFANRQVIVRGTWRETNAADHKPVFAISELRIMPSANN
jgi:SH3-like domain-containing protein